MFNRSFNDCKINTCQVSDRNYNFHLGMALKDVVEYIRDAIAIIYVDNSIPVFTQKPVTDMNNDRLLQHSPRYDSTNAVALTQNTHATQGEKIQEKIPSLCVAKTSGEVTLNIDDEVGRPL